MGRTAVVAAVAAPLTPPAAGAHLRTGTIAVDYEASVSSPRSSAAGPFSVGVPRATSRSTSVWAEVIASW